MAFEQSPQNALSAAGQPSWIAPVKPVVPDHELFVRIGGGSYGDVWLARSVVGTWRAVKVVFRDRFLDAKPFEREFSGIQKFEPLSRSNEGFIDILQIGRNDADGYFYYVMELADDASDAPEIKADTYVPKTLSKALLQRGRLPVSDCLELGVTLNLGLTRLHEAGLIHRDIKPSNIIFVNGVPKLADIGLVIEVAEARSYVGTEGFIPPEGPNSPQADIYSLGKVLYEAGMGKDRKDFPEPLSQIAHAPDSTELLEFNAILLKACAANLKDRYQSAGEMNVDLALLQSGGSVRRQRTLARRLRSIQRTGALVTALAAVIGAGWLWQVRQTRAVRELALEKSRLADEKSRLVDENRERLVRLDIANGVRLMDGGDLSGSRILSEAETSTGARYRASADLSAALLWFAEALSGTAQDKPEAEIQRIRIQTVLSTMPKLVQMTAHESSVRAGVFSPDGRVVATGSQDGEVRVWDVATAKPVFKPLHLGKSIGSLRFTRDGRRLVVRSTSDFSRASRPEAAPFAMVVEATTGEQVMPPITNATRTAYSADDRWLAVGREDFSVDVLEAGTGAPVRHLVGHASALTTLVFSPDGTKLLTGSADGAVMLWGLPSGERLGGVHHHEARVLFAAFSPDGVHFATGTEPSTNSGSCLVRVWNSSTGELVGAPVPAVGYVEMLSFCGASAERLIIGDVRSFLGVRNIYTQAEALPALKMKGGVFGWALSPGEGLLAVANQDNSAYVWNLKTGQLVLPALHHNGWVEAVCFSPDGTRLLTTSPSSSAGREEISIFEAASADLLENPVCGQPSGL